MYEEIGGGRGICALELQYSYRDDKTRDRHSKPFYGSEADLNPSVT